MGILISIFFAIVRSTFKFAATYISLKAFLTTLFLIVFPVVISNYAGKWLEDIYTKIGQTATDNTSGLHSFTFQFSGLSAFFINHLRIADGLSLVFSAIATRLTLSLIPFSKI